MARWHDITRDPEYQSLSPQAKLEVKREFFNRTISKDEEFVSLSPEAQQATFEEFINIPDDTGQGYVTSMLGSAGRGFGEMIPGAVEGVGALTGSQGIREFGQDIRSGLESISPVNPLYAESIPVKLAGVGGQALSVLATAGAGGAAGKALGGVGAATKGMQAAPLASAFLQGAAGGAREAEQYGMAGPEAYLKTLSGGALEAGTELLPFGMAAETALARRMFAGAPRTTTLAGAMASEAGEESLGQIGSNMATQVLAPIGVETPGIMEGALEAGAYGAFGGAVIGGINALIPTAPEKQTREQQQWQAEINATPVDVSPNITPEESQKNAAEGGIPVVTPDGVVSWMPAMRSAMTAPTEQASAEPSVTEQRLRSLTDPAIQVASDALNATANVPFTDISGQAAAATVAQNAELSMQPAIQSLQAAEETAPEVTPSPEMEMPEKPSQTITGSNVQTGTEMPVPGKSTVTSPGEAPLVTPEEESLAAQRRANLLSAAADAAKGKTKAQVSPVVTAMVTPQQPTQQENAVQEQITDEGVLRQERPEMELQGMGEQNVQPQETATEGQIQEEVIAAPGESEQGTLYGKPSKLTDKDRGQAVSLAKTLQPGDVVETNDGQETFRYKVVVEDGTRLLRKIDQRGDIIEGVREKFLANPARTSSQGELAAIPDGRDTIDVIARGRIIRSGTEVQPTIQVATERDLTKPEQMTPEELLAFEKSQAVASAEEALQRAKKGQEVPNVFLNGFKSKAALVRAREQQLEEARNYSRKPDVWNIVMEAAQAKKPISAALVESFDDRDVVFGVGPAGEPGGVSPSPRKQVMERLQGYVRQGDLYVFQPSLEQSGLGAGAATAPQGVIESPTALKAETSLVNQLNAATSRQEAQTILESATAEQVKEAAQEMGYPATGTKKAIASRLVAAVGSRADAKAIRQQSPQTTAAETQTPESLRVDSGAAGVVQSEPSRGSILEVEKESAKTAIESTEKSLANLSAESLIDKLDTINNLPHKRDKVASMLRDELRRFPQKKVAEIAKLLGTKANVDAVVVNIMLESRFVEKGMDAVDPELRRQRDEEEEERREAAMSYARLHDKERSSNIVTGKVTMADARQAAGLLQNNGISPNAAFTWMGTVDDLLALKNTPFGESHKKLIEQVAANKNIEGTYSNGTAFVFVDQVVVSNLDRRRAKELGISEGVAAAMRVIDHENGHFGMDILSAGEKARIMAFLRTQFTPESLDALAYSRYPSLRKWRTNPESEMRLLDERLRQYIEETKTIPTDGVWKQFWDYIKAIWRKWTGKPQGEPTLQSMKDVVRLIRKALKDAHKQRPDQTKGGDRVLMSYAGEKAIENLPEERRQFMRDSLDAAKAMAAAGKDSEEIRAVTGWFPGKYDGKMRWEVPDDKVTESLVGRFSVDSSTKESFEERDRRLYFSHPKNNPEFFVEPSSRSFFGRKTYEAFRRSPRLDRLVRDNLVSLLPRESLGVFATEEEANAAIAVARAEFEDKRTQALSQTQDIDIRLKDVLFHPELFNAYPDLKEVRVTMSPAFFDLFQGVQGWFQDQTNTINVTPYAVDKKSTLLHEIQHWIQKEEGFARGTSPMEAFSGVSERDIKDKARELAEKIREQKNTLTGYMRNRMAQLRNATTAEEKEIANRGISTISNWFKSEQKTLEDLESGDLNKISTIVQSRSGSEFYNRVAGEIEARDVQARKDLTPEQRAATAPYSSENIAPEDAIVLFGGGPQMSVSGTSQFVPAVNLNGRIETGTSHYEAWLKHAIRQIPSYKKDGLSDSEVKDLADRWLVDHPEAMANSMTKEGFVTDEGYLNRQDSLKKFLALGGKQRLDPGEVRDWLDSSDLEDARFSISYASETSQASSLGQQTAREMTASPRKLEAIIGVRQAYESMPKVHGNAVSLAELFDAAAKIVPNLTQVEFNSVVQGMYEDNAALLNTGAMSSEKPSPGGLNEAEDIENKSPGVFRLFNAIMASTDPGSKFTDSVSIQRPGNQIAGYFLGASTEAVKGYGNVVKELAVTITKPLVLDRENYTPMAFHELMSKEANVTLDAEDLSGLPKEPVYTFFSPGMASNPFDSRDLARQLVARGYDAVVMWDDSAYEGNRKRPTVWIPYPKADNIQVLQSFDTSRAAGGTSQFNVLNRDNEPALSVVILPGRGMASLGTALSPDIRFSIASTPEQQSAAAKFKSAIIEAAKGTNKQRDYEGRPIKDRIINPLSSDVQDFVEIGQHNTVAFGAFMDAADEMLESMVKDGMSLDEILSKIQSSSFQQELGMFTVEAGQGMAMRAVMGLLLRKTANAERSAKTKAEKIQSSMLHRKAANYFTAVASTPSGQNLYALQALYNDPRTRFIFMENRALADMLKKADHGVNLRFDGAYGATQEATDTNVNASATAATKNIADQAEEAEEDDQDAIDLAAGEATLKDPEKSLYEEYKDLLREEGILARLDREEAETGAKMSISPQRRSELAGLTKEERAKLREKNKQRRMEILSKLLGREEDAKTPEQKATRKKREKMAQTAQKRAQKGKEIEVTPTSLGKIINQARRDIKGPTGKPIQWREIFRQPAKSVEEFRKNILLAIMGNDAFKDMDDAQKRQIADMFAEAWGKEREKVLNQLQKRHEDNLEAQGKREAAKALREARNQILEIANLGVFSNDELTRILGEKFGFKTSFTEAEQQKLSELAEKIQDESLSKPVRNKLAREFLATLQSGTQISIAELLSNWWVASVLSGGNTITAIALSFTNGTGIGILGTHIARAIRNMVKGDTAGAIEAITSMFKAYAKHIASFPSAANRAWNYLWTGDVSLLEASANDPFKNVRSLADIARYQIVADQVAKDPNKVKAVMGRFMQFMGRLLSALDAFNVMITKAGTTSLAIRQSGLTADQIRDAELKNDLKFYKDKIIREDPYFNGKAPTSSFDKAYLASLAEAALYKDLAEFGVKMENADYLAAEAAMTMTPTGVGGIVYNKIKALDKDITTETRERLKQAEKAWAAEKDIDTGLKLFTWRALNFLAEQGINALGLRFARFAGNKFNQSLSYIPVLGALRVFETGNKELAGREEAFKDTIIRNQTIGFIMIIAGMKIIEAIADEPDDKKRGWFINGGWNNLTPDQKKQRLSLGEKQYTIGIGDQVFNYQNWPIGQAIAAIGELSDMIRFSPEKWKEKTTVGKFGSSLVSGMTSALEIPALTQVGEIFGNTMAAKDPSEQTISRLSRVMAGWAGGFMPRFLKDIDYMLKPEMRKYESFYEKAASHIPIYRSYVGKEYYDIFGNQIKKNAIPGSRDFDRLAQEPEYKLLGALNARGIWLTPANAEYRMIGKGRYRRRLTQEEADRYSLETGKLYKQMIMRFGPRALQMPVEQAKDYISAKADDMRDLALLKAVR